MNVKYVELCHKLSKQESYVKEPTEPWNGWVRMIAARDPVLNRNVIEKCPCDEHSRSGGPYLPKGLPVIGGRAAFWEAQMPKPNVEGCMSYEDLPGRGPTAARGKNLKP